MEVQQLIKSLRNKHDIVCDVAADLLVSYAKTSLKQYQEIEMLMNENKRLEAELAAYRTAEQDGTLLRLPCKVGDIIYDIRGDLETGEPMIIPHRVEAIYPTIRENGKFGFNLYATDFGFSITEKTNMYYSREAAKAALKEQEADDGKQ